MTELIDIIVKFLNSIPTGASAVLGIGLLAYFVRYQLKINEKIGQRLDKGVTNFTMIDDNFKKVDDHFIKFEERDIENHNKIHLELRSIHRMVLKSIIYNEEMDVFERQDAYDEYLGLGGNGFTKRYYEDVISPIVKERIDERLKHKES